MLNLNDTNLRLIKNDSQTDHDAVVQKKNYTEPPDAPDGNLQNVSSKAFSSLQHKYRRKNSIKNNDNNDSSTSTQNQLTLHPVKERKQSDDGSSLRWQRLTDMNCFKHFNTRPACALKQHDSNYCSNSPMIDLKRDNNVPKCPNRVQSSTEPIVPNSQPNDLGNEIRTTESWREANFAEKFKIAALLLNSNSLTNKIMPVINLHALANPLLQIPIQVCRMANNINLNMGEVLCRKRTEVAVISWMAITLNQ